MWLEAVFGKATLGSVGRNQPGHREVLCVGAGSTPCTCPWRRFSVPASVWVSVSQSELPGAMTECH